MPNFAELLGDPTTSSFVREVVRLTAGRDTVDVVNDLDVLVRACKTEGDNVMDKFLVRRIVREDVVVEAEDAAEAESKAIAMEDTLKWDCYDCEYSVEPMHGPGNEGN
jgi:hypothetical protein